MRLSLWVLIFHRVDFSHFILLLSKYWILSIINQALSKTKELPEIESRYFASEEEFPSLLASRQFIKAVILRMFAGTVSTPFLSFAYLLNSSLCIYLWLFALFEAFFGGHFCSKLYAFMVIKTYQGGNHKSSRMKNF